MATNYPTEKDGWSDKSASMTIYAADFVNLQDAVAALEAKVGKNNAATDISIDYRINYLIASTNYLFFYENTAPTGWVATMTIGDYVCGVIASSGLYNASGGTTAGVWDMTGYVASDTHAHVWMYYSALNNYTYNSGGTAIQYGVAGGTYYTGNANNNRTLAVKFHTKNTSNDAEVSFHTSTAYTNQDTHNHTYTAAWRPSASVGVLAYYTGA